MTTDNEKKLSFGNYLKSAREERGLSLEVVSGYTKISPAILLSLENEEIDKLPSEVFIKGFLRIYSELLKVDNVLVTQLYLSSLHAWHEEARFRAMGNRSAGQFWILAAVSVSVLLVFILLTVTFLSKEIGLSRKSPDGESQAVTEGSMQELHHLDIFNNKDNKKESYLLEVIASKKTMFKVIIDGRKPEEYRMTRGKRVTFDAEKKINLLISDADAVRLVLNGKIIPVEGRQGQYVNVVLP
ncbi:MAG: DUF4115 domain-containing protein [Desulfobacterales bacterium]|nr:DUF4115 domain-containing protein [Desulfobacterales bacterium]